MIKEFLGEVIGTFTLVFIGCSSVALAVLFGVFTNLFQVAVVWGVGVALAIIFSRNLSSAHLNPAVTLGFYFAGYFRSNKILIYFLGQFVGAFLAGFLVFLIFENGINLFEASHQITRGESSSYHSAVMFGEFFPNPGYEGVITISWLGAMLYELMGTAFLMLMIFLIVRIFKNKTVIIPWLIGLTITVLILLIAPYTQAGFNPARDLSPRLVAFLMGWGEAAFPPISYSFFTVYVLGPILGASLIGLIWTLLQRKVLISNL